jgi:tetratricopeptide (TPR) repeat protein
MNNIRNIVACICAALTLVCSAQTSNAQWMILKSDGDSLLNKGIHAIYNVQFDSAHVYFSSVIARYPNHPAGYFLDAMVEWWKISLNRGQTSNDEIFLEKIDKVLEVCENIRSTEPSSITALFFQGGALGFRGRYHATRENYFRAVNDGRDAMDIMSNCYRIAPNNHDIMLGTGLYNYFAAALPERIPVIKPFMSAFPSGDKELGLLQLKAAASKARYAKVEAKVLLNQVYADFEKNQRLALPYALELSTTYPNNPLFRRSLARAYVGTGNSDTAEILWREILVKCLDKQPYYDSFAAREALYYVGLYRMRAKDYDLALRYLYKADEACRWLDQDPSGFMIRTNLLMGQIYDLQHKRDLAERQYRKVLQWNDVGNVHSEANKYLQQPFTH